MKYTLIAALVIVAGLFALHFMKAPGTQTAGTPLPPGVVVASWRQPQACPQYGGAKQCYVAEGAFGGYLNWASTHATFIWRVNPCPAGKKVVTINSSSCVYETNGMSHVASTSLDAAGYAIIDCRPFASQYKDNACNCNNGITLNAQVQCQ